MAEQIPGPQDPPIDQGQMRLHLAYAEASVMLLECLMLVLIERNVVPMDSLLEAVETAIATKKGQIKDADHPHISAVAVAVLSQIANSIAAGQARNH